jgi:multidrug efflux pump subunit AcrB
VGARIVQRLDYPQYMIEVDRTKAADLGLNQADVMRNVVAAFSSSVQFNKRNFWTDPVSHNQYYVGVQYPEERSRRRRRSWTCRPPARCGRRRSRCGTSPRCGG